MNFKHLFYIGLIAFLLYGCTNKQKADVIFYHGRVYTVDSTYSKTTAFAVKDGKFIAVGDDKVLMQNFDAPEKIDLMDQFVYPGFNDAHSHFYGLGKYLTQVDLNGTKSWSEVVERCRTFHEKTKQNFVLGRGWDQNDWDVKEFPSNEELNKLFPDIPVLLKRVDGHAAVANDQLLTRANITELTKMEGGKVITQNHKPTGVLIDNAVDIVQKYLPLVSLNEKAEALLNAQKVCFENGLTTVCDAGLSKDVIDLIDSLQKSGRLLIRIYAMIDATDENLDRYLLQKPYKTERLNVGSFKMYADGALGSRGACLLQPYDDEKNNSGLLLTPVNKMEEYVKRIADSKYQLNTHCIGDSGNRVVLKLYAKYLKGSNDRRWRIEHAQVINENDFAYYKNYSIIPSVQPTHATSDMYWAVKRLGDDRIKGAYAYKRLMEQNGWLPLGTDFPVESVNPFYTFYSAVARKDGNGIPPDGFQMENALNRRDALRGMTIWPAKAAFEESEKGSIEPGKFADFIVLDSDLMTDDLVKIRNNSVIETYVNGKKVYGKN